MHSLTYIMDTKRAKNSSIQQNRYFADSQVMNKNALENRRYHTEPINEFDSITPYSNPSQSQIREKKFIQQSNFLPIIHNRDARDSRRMSENRTLYDEEKYSANSQVQTIQCLNECQQIIANLKRLASMSTRKVQKLKQNFKSPFQLKRGSNSFRKDEWNRADRMERERYDSQHYPGDWGKRGKIESQPSIFGFDPTSELQEKRGRNLQRQSKLFSIDIKKRKDEGENEKNKSKNLETNRSKKGLKSSESFEQNTSEINEKSRIISKNIDIKIRGFQDSNGARTQRSEARIPFQQQSGYEAQNSRISRLNSQQQEQRSKREQQQLQKARARQKFLLKFLNKARCRGEELQKKITQKRKLSGYTNSSSNKGQKKDEQKYKENKIQEQDENQQVSGKQQSQVLQQNEPQASYASHLVEQTI